MLKIERRYYTYCTEKSLDPFEEKSCEKFFEEFSQNKELFLKEINELKLNADPRSRLHSLFSVVIANHFEGIGFIFTIIALNSSEEMTISERKKSLEESIEYFYSDHVFGNKKRNDFITTCLTVTECLRTEDYDLAYEICDEVFNKRYHNPCLTNFFKLYIDIFSNKEIDVQKEFDEDKFGTFPILSDVLYYFYCLREEETSEVESTLEKIKKQSKKMYLLISLNFISAKIDTTKLPKYSYCKTLGLIDPNENYFEYKESFITLIEFMKFACDYYFNYFYEYIKSVGKNYTQFIDEKMTILSTEEKMIAVAIILFKVRTLVKFDSTKSRISDIKNLILNPNGIGKDNKEFESTLKILDNLFKGDESIVENALLNLESHDMISDLDFENDTFEVNDELYIFADIFINGLSMAFKNNPSLDSDEIEDFSVTGTFNDDKPGNES